MSNEAKKIKVASTDDLQLALAAGYEGSQIEVDVSAAVAAARAEGVAEGKAANAPDLTAVRKEAAEAERARITKIHSLARAGFDKEMQEAIDSGAEPSAFALSLIEAANDRGITIDAIKKDSPPAASHAKPGDEDKKVVAIDTAAIYAARGKKE